jgi:hypothetical protein
MEIEKLKKNELKSERPSKKVDDKKISEQLRAVNTAVAKTLNEMNDKKKEKDMTATTGKGGGLRFNQGKLRYDLVEPRAHRDMVEVLTDGANKYFDRNWENGLSWTSVLASLKRHIAAIERGEDRDPESGRLHIAHAACNVHFLNTFYYTFPQGDDRPKRFLKLPNIGIDIDGVLADFTTAWNEIYPEISATPSSWYLDRKIGQRFDEMRKNGTLDDFYLDIPALLKPEDLPFEPCCYITSRPVAKEITEQWIDNNGFPRRKVISLDIKKSKVEAAKEAGVEVFVDDSYDNFVELNNAGVFTYLYTAPWNTRYDVGHMRLNSLKDMPLVQH